MSKKNILKGIGLQFFAEPTDPPQDPNPQDPPQDPPPKTYSQEEVNRMMATEKRQGKQGILKELGLDPNDKDAVKKAKEILDAQKTQKERDDEALTAEKNARTQAEAKALAAERKLLILGSGCKTEFVDEVTALVNAKVTDETDFDTALKAVREKCPSFFNDEEDEGTGGGQGHKRQKNKEKAGSLGTRLAQGSASQSYKDNNPYFS